MHACTHVSDYVCYVLILPPSGGCSGPTNETNVPVGWLEREAWRDIQQQHGAMGVGVGRNNPNGRDGMRKGERHFDGWMDGWRGDKA